MKPADLTTQQAREFASATVSIRTNIDHTTASHDALVGAIEKDLATNLSSKRAFTAFTAKADRSNAIADASHAHVPTVEPATVERVSSKADRALQLRADESKLPAFPPTSSRAEAALALWSSQRRARGGASQPSKGSRAEKALEMRFGARTEDDGQ